MGAWREAVGGENGSVGVSGHDGVGEEWAAALGIWCVLRGTVRRFATCGLLAPDGLGRGLEWDDMMEYG